MGYIKGVLVARHTLRMKKRDIVSSKTYVANEKCHLIIHKIMVE
jgi:hypothetical protein